MNGDSNHAAATEPEWWAMDTDAVMPSADIIAAATRTCAGPTIMAAAGTPMPIAEVTTAELLTTVTFRRITTAPSYYGWAYNPWAAPVAYGWGWGGSPWYGYYGYYFAPAPVYATPSLWITDYLLAANLQAAYDARATAKANAAAAADDDESASSGGGGGEAL